MKAVVFLEHWLHHTRFLWERIRPWLDTIRYEVGLLLNPNVLRISPRRLPFPAGPAIEYVYSASGIPGGSLDEVCLPPSYGTHHFPNTKRSQKLHQTKETCLHSVVAYLQIVCIPLEQK